MLLQGLKRGQSHQGYRIKQLKQQLEQAQSYEEWKSLALKIDEASGAQEWKYDNSLAIAAGEAAVGTHACQAVLHGFFHNRQHGLHFSQ